MTRARILEPRAHLACGHHDLRQFDNLVHALYAVIHRDLKDRMLLLDPQSDFFRSFIGRIRVFHLPIHLEAKWAAVRPLALRDRLRDGFLRRGWHGYGGARLSRRRCHLMISFGRARTVSAAPLSHHARSKKRVSQQIRTIWAAAPDAAQAPAVWAAGLSLRAAAVSWQPFSQVLFETADKVMPDRHAEILP